MAKTNSGLLEFKDAQKVLIALDDATSEVKKAVIIAADGTETDIAGGGGGVTVEALSVTENGTYSEEGKAYSPVEVNVAGGSSDFSTAEVTIICNIEDGTTFEGAVIRNNRMDISQHIHNGSNAITCVLYKGENYCGTYDTDMSTAVITGNAEYSSEDDCYIVTGDCTITISTGE